MEDQNQNQDSPDQGPTPGSTAEGGAPGNQNEAPATQEQAPPPPAGEAPAQEEKTEAGAEFDEAEAIINEMTSILKTLQTTDRFKFLAEKFAEKFPDKVDGLNGVIGSLVEGFAKSIEIKKAS